MILRLSCKRQECLLYNAFFNPFPSEMKASERRCKMETQGKLKTYPFFTLISGQYHLHMTRRLEEISTSLVSLAQVHYGYVASFFVVRGSTVMNHEGSVVDQNVNADCAGISESRLDNFQQVDFVVLDTMGPPVWSKSRFP